MTATALESLAMQPPSRDDFATALGLRIATARKAAGLSQYALAELLPKGAWRGSGGPDQTVVSKWENGERTPSAWTLTALARALHVSSDWLLGLDEHMQPPSDGNRP